MYSTVSPRLLAGFGALLAVIVAVATLGLVLMEDLSDRASRIASRNIPELTNTATIQTALEELRQVQLRHLLEDSVAEKDRAELQMLDLRVKITGSLQERVRITPPNEPQELQEVRDMLGAWGRYVRLSSRFIVRSRAGDRSGGLGILRGTAQTTFVGLHAELADLQAEEQAQAQATSAAGRRSYLAARRTFVVAVSATLAGAGLLGLWFLVISPLRRSGALDRYRRRFHDALEMADTEEDALDVTARALSGSAATVPAELLLADSSQSHLNQAVVSGPDPEGPGCPVSSPHGCAAVRRGQTTVFDSSEDVDACPRLRGRPGGPCSAVCAPVTVLGRTIGVLHATGEAGRPPSAAVRDTLETTGAQVGSRLGVIRAMSQSQLQASTDPLTGLLNRRSLEDRVRDLRRAQTPFVVAMADLDHFKQLNDSAGHETGDRALRLFARILAETVRAEDVVARHGGEEFVVVFPRCSTHGAAEVLERVRDALSRAVTAAGVPAFTFSAGVADSGPGDSFHEVLRAADEALLSAKRAGRDRVLIASPIGLGA